MTPEGIQSGVRNNLDGSDLQPPADGMRRWLCRCRAYLDIPVSLTNAEARAVIQEHADMHLAAMWDEAEDVIYRSPG